MPPPETPHVSARFDLLDQQIVDCDGIPVGRADDIALEMRPDGLHVAALLTGQRALGARLGGVLGTTLVAIAARLAADERPDQPRSVPVDEITAVRPMITLRHQLSELTHLASLEHWLADHLVSRLPGSGR